MLLLYQNFDHKSRTKILFLTYVKRRSIIFVYGEKYMADASYWVILLWSCGLTYFCAKYYWIRSTIDFLEEQGLLELDDEK